MQGAKVSQIAGRVQRLLGSTSGGGPLAHQPPGGAELGILGTGLARSMQATLVGRVGAPRASIVGYLLPVFAAVLGVAVLDESIGWLEIAGLALVLVGATGESAGTGEDGTIQSPPEAARSVRQMTDASHPPGT